MYSIRSFKLLLIVLYYITFYNNIGIANRTCMTLELFQMFKNERKMYLYLLKLFLTINPINSIFTTYKTIILLIIVSIMSL